MATSGSKSVSVTSYNTLKFSWTEKSQSIEDNKTVINWTMQLIADSSGRISSTASKDWSVTVNGTKYSGTNTVGISANTTKTLASGSTTISHNADGTKTFSYSFSQEFGITFSGASIGTKTGSGSGTLDTIPRKSSMTVGNGTLGTAQTLSVSRSSSNFTHTITYSCGSASGTIATKSSSTSISFTPPLSLASQNTSGTSVSIKYTITTYNGNTSLGSNSYTKTCTIPASVKPSCSIAVSDPTGIFTKYGYYVKGKSKLAVTVTATTSYGSAIASYSSSANGAKYTSASFTTGFLTASGNGSITSTVTDKRGRTASATASYTVQNYTAPTITKMTAVRCTENGTEDEHGEFVKATFTATVTALNNKNTAAYSLRYKKTSASTYTEVKLTSYNNVFSVTNASYIFPADSSFSYDVEIVVTDDFGTSRRASSASTGFSLLHWKANGRGFAVGKISEKDDYFESGFHMWSAFGELMTAPVELQSNQDLNALTEPGYYLVGNTTVSPTLKNRPPFVTDNGTALIAVLPMGDGMQRCQRYYVCTKSSQFVFQRIYYTSSWGDWMIVSGCTDWRELTIASGFELYASTSQPKYRINGNNVTVFGAVKPTEIITSGTTDIKIAGTIPEAFRPSYTQPFICQGSGINRWCFSIKTDGNLYVGRYGTNDYVDIPVGAWLIFSASYSI